MRGEASKSVGRLDHVAIQLMTAYRVVVRYRVCVVYDEP